MRVPGAQVNGAAARPFYQGMTRAFDASRGGFSQHVIQRGFARGCCFADDADRRAYLKLLGMHAAQLECRLHAYVLMGNHIHLLLTAVRAGGSARLMQALRAGYTRQATGSDENAFGQRRATLEEPCDIFTIHAARHLLSCMRYIELNPVRARLVRRPENYPWSSYAANAALQTDDLITPHPFYLALARTPQLRAAAYRISFDRMPGAHSIPVKH